MEERLPEKTCHSQACSPETKLDAAKTRQTFQPPKFPRAQTQKSQTRHGLNYSQAEIVQQSTFTAFSRPQMPKKSSQQHCAYISPVQDKAPNRCSDEEVRSEGSGTWWDGTLCYEACQGGVPFFRPRVHPRLRAWHT